MAGQLIKAPVPIAIFFLFIFGVVFAGKGIEADSRPVIVIGCIMIVLSLYHTIQWVRVKSRNSE